jgi:periplasmic divalent cation tolerance protein
MQAIAVFTTVSQRAEAQAMAKALVERKLAACAQISEIESYYRWDGAVQYDHEYRILFKTTQARYDTVVQAIKELHAYDLPAIHAVTLDRIDAPYAAWIEQNAAP